MSKEKTIISESVKCNIGVFMPELGEKVKRNLKDRFTEVKRVPKRELEIVKTSVRDIVALKPVPAVVDLVVDTIDNIGDFVKTQSSITRRWID